MLCFLCHSIEVVQASGECLRAVLATKTGGQVLGKVEEMCLENDWHLYLEPFKPQRRKKVRGNPKIMLNCSVLLCVTLCYCVMLHCCVILFCAILLYASMSLLLVILLCNSTILPISFLSR